MNLNILEGIRRGRNFFELVGDLGRGLLLVLSIFTSFFFWVFIMMFYSPLTEVGIFMARLFQLAFIMFVAGYLFKTFLDFVYEHFYNKEIKAYQIKESENVRIKPRKRK
jgi:hypothetical protein